MTYNYPWNKKTILVTEDDPLNYRYLELLLSKKTGANIIWAKKGKEAIDTIKTNTEIDIVLLDLQLPDIEGYEVLKVIKKHIPEMPVLIQTAHAWNDEDKTCLKLGADGFFTKPINMDSLLNAIMLQLLKRETTKPTQ